MPTLTTSAAALAAGWLKELYGSGTVIQIISGLVVTPGPNSVSFSFQTRLSSFPLIEIFKYGSGDPTTDMTATNLVTNNSIQLQNKTRKKKQSYRLPEPDSFVPASFPGFSDPILAPLNQDSHYWFRITADTALTDIAPAVTIGRFWTAKRDVTGVVEELIVYSYGDSDFGQDLDEGVNDVYSFFGQAPPNTSDYHLNLQLAVYDPVQDKVAELDKLFPSENQSDDLRNPFPNQPLICSGANDFLWMYAFGQGNPGAWSLSGFSGTSNAPNVPPIVISNGNNPYGPYAEAFGMSVKLPDTEAELGAFQGPIPFVISTGPGDTSYDVTTWLYVNLTPPRHAPIIYASPVQNLTSGLANSQVKRLQHSHKMSTKNEGVLFMQSKGKMHAIVPSSGHTLMANTQDSKHVNLKANAPYVKLGEGLGAPLAVLQNEDGTLDVVATDTDGYAQYGQWDGTMNGAAKTKWHRLDQPAGEEIALVRGKDGLHVFTLNRRGAALHSHIATNGKRTAYESLGGHFSGNLQAIQTEDGNLYFFALGIDGDVCYIQIVGSETKQTTDRIASLGGIDTVQFCAIPEDKHGIAIYALNKKRKLAHKVYNGSSFKPSLKGWEDMGLLDSLFGPTTTTA
jgi:hypothetical protein